MDKEVDQEREVEEPSVSQATHKSIFDLPAEIITHIVSFLSLQGNKPSSGQASLVIAVMFRCLQTGSHLSCWVLHHSRREVLGAPPCEGVRSLLYQGQAGYCSVLGEEQGESI